MVDENIIRRNGKFARKPVLKDPGNTTIRISLEIRDKLEKIKRPGESWKKLVIRMMENTEKYESIGRREKDGEDVII